MQGLMALFAIIGAAFVLAAIWFFFWAKNGGFVWRKNDWDDYKSTVLRRKGPDGRTLSNATKSTKLGGGSVVAGQTEGYTDYDGEDAAKSRADDAQTYATTDAAPSEKSRNKKSRFREKLRRKKKAEKWEGEHDNDVREYRYEKPAEVGGLNRQPDGTYYDGSTEPTDSNPPMSEVNNGQASRYGDYVQPNRQRDASGFSFAPGGEDTISYITGEDDRDVTEQQPLREDRPRSRRHDHHHRTSTSTCSQRPRGPRPSSSNSRAASPRKKPSMPGSYTMPLDMSSNATSDYQYEQVGVTESPNGNRAYHHPIPALTKGFRRHKGGRGTRRDSLSESDGEESYV
jgi:hypothetical protein